MLYIDIAGNGPRKTCRGVIEWFKSQYLPRHHLEISIHYRGLKRDGVMGWCMVEGQICRPRSFLIEIQSGLNEEDHLKTLFHELWHVYQHIKGTLSEPEAETMEEVLYDNFLTHRTKLSYCPPKLACRV